MEMEREELAREIYDTYCAAVGGKAFNGDRLPPWGVFQSDPAKRKQAEAWMTVADKAAALLEDEIADKLAADAMETEIEDRANELAEAKYREHISML